MIFQRNFVLNGTLFVTKTNCFLNLINTKIYLLQIRVSILQKHTIERLFWSNLTLE